jgi:hypothetical protein
MAGFDLVTPKLQSICEANINRPCGQCPTLFIVPECSYHVNLFYAKD